MVLLGRRRLRFMIYANINICLNSFGSATCTHGATAQKVVVSSTTVMLHSHRSHSNAAAATRRRVCFESPSFKYKLGSYYMSFPSISLSKLHLSFAIRSLSIYRPYRPNPKSISVGL